MPVSYYQAIRHLKQAHSELPWYQKLFFPYQLGKKLEEFPVEIPNQASKQLEGRSAAISYVTKAFEVFKIYEENTWFFQRWWFSALQIFYDHPHTKLLRWLNNFGLLTNTTLGQANFNAVVGKFNLRKLIPALGILHAAGLLTEASAQANFEMVLLSVKPKQMASVLSLLKKRGLLSDQATQGHLLSLQTYANFCKVKQFAQLADMTELEIFNAVVAHPYSDQLVVALDLLNRAEMLSGEEAAANFRAVFDHADPITAAVVLRYLHRYELVTGPNAGANRQAMMTHNIVAVERVLKKLSHLPKRRNVQTCFDAMLAHASLFLDDKVGKRIWSQLPNHRKITLQELSNMIEIAEKANPDEQDDLQRLESLHTLLFGNEPPVAGSGVMRQNPNNFFSGSAPRSGDNSVSASQDKGQSAVPSFH